MKTDSRVQATSAAGNKFLQEHAPWELMKKKTAGEAEANGGGGDGDEQNDPGRAAAGVLLRAGAVDAPVSGWRVPCRSDQPARVLPGARPQRGTQ